MIERTARCACGQASVTARGEARKVGACHCRACQRRTGSAFGVAAYFRRGQITPAGELARFVRTADSGLEVTFHFCAVCGTTLYWLPQVRPDYAGLAYGCFDDPAGLGPPALAVFDDERHPWVTLACGGVAGGA